jgi:hypothetical protein
MPSKENYITPYLPIIEVDEIIDEIVAEESIDESEDDELIDESEESIDATPVSETEAA